MRYPRVVAALTVGILAVAWLAISPASAQDEPLPLDVDPTSGPVGTTIDVAGGDCPNGEVLFGLLAGTNLDDATGFVDSNIATPDADGNWSGELFVFDTLLLFEEVGDVLGDFHDEVDVVPGEDYFVTAGCFLGADIDALEGEELSELGDLADTQASAEASTDDQEEELDEDILFYEIVPFDITEDGPVTPPPARPVVETPAFTG